MARKITLTFDDSSLTANAVSRYERELTGYEIKDLAIFKSPVTKLWRCVHINTLSPTMHEEKGWKSKKEALAFATELQSHGLNFSVNSAEEFQAKNNSDLMAVAFKAAIEKAKEV